MKRTILFFSLFLLLISACTPTPPTEPPAGTQPPIEALNPDAPQIATLPPGTLEGIPTPPPAFAPPADQLIIVDEARALYRTEQGNLLVEFLDDDLLHFEYSGPTVSPDVEEKIFSSPMVAKTDYLGPAVFETSPEGVLRTRSLEVEVDASLCLRATDITRQPPLTLTRLCPNKIERNRKSFFFTPESFTHIYGLGQQFTTPNQPDGDWAGKVRFPGDDYGNAMVGWNGGAAGNTQFSVAYFTGASTDNYALYLDNASAQQWDFRDPQAWKISAVGPGIRFYLMAGPDLPDLRADYLEITGRPPVPPKKMFGLWVSEYGFDNWRELDEKLSSLRANRYPVDGFVLDLQWFGGIQSDSDNTRMGSLTWDLASFSSPAAKIDALQAQGVGIMTIEESYIGKNLPEHRDLESRGYLVERCEGCEAVYLTENPWWGKGGMLDWSDAQGAAYWHDLKREPLIEAGVIGHWTDLGEPELYSLTSWYTGIPEPYAVSHIHPDTHNLYNFLWSQSIYDGYLRNQHDQRPFILSRSGAPGSQRLGVAMWSGDVGANLTTLATQMNNQMHMSFAGMDYYGSDVGGFHRGALDGNLDRMYTRWFGNAALLEIPLRPHTENLCNCKETAPDRIGSQESNLFNLRLRYSLVPYLYSLAHRAYLYGEPVYPPLAFYYQTDPQTHAIGQTKLIGRDLLVYTVPDYATYPREVYLPAGQWVNFYTDEWHTSQGAYLKNVQVREEDLFRLPLFARAGAIIPQMWVDEQTMNVFGQRLDGSTRDELILRVYAHPSKSEFTLLEDDGVTTAYQRGEVRATRVTQQLFSGQAVVRVEPAQGSYAGAPAERPLVVRLSTAMPLGITQVLVNGEELPRFASQAELEQAESGWLLLAENVILAKSARDSVDQAREFVFRYQ